MRARLLLPFVILGAALAQGPMGPRGAMRAGRPGVVPQAPQMDELKAYLNLTDAQIQSIQQARQQIMTSQQTVVEQIQAKRQALHDLLDKGTTDAAAVGKLMLEIRALEKQIEQARTTIQNQALGFLTAEQKTKLAALEQAAKLQPAIHQAAMLGLLQPPTPGPFGPGGAPGFAPERQRFAPGFRPMGRMHRPVQ